MFFILDKPFRKNIIEKIFRKKSIKGGLASPERYKVHLIFKNSYKIIEIVSFGTEINRSTE